MAHVQRTGHVEVVVPVAPEAVWRVVSDVTRTGEWSHECGDVHWLGGAVAAAPGVRFRGRNTAGWVRWARLCEVVAVDELRELAWRTVPTPLFPDSTVWRIRLEPAEGGTRIVQEFEVVKAPVVLEPLYAAIIPTHRDRTVRLSEDLVRIGTAAAGGAAPEGEPAPRPPGPGLRRRLTRQSNRFGVWLYRRLDGRLASGRPGAGVLLVTVAGRRTGASRSTCVRYLAVDDGWVVWGTGSGSRRDPDWFENLRRATTATVQIGARVTQVSPRELAGPERDQMWQHVILARAPEVARYAGRAARTIPVAMLTPLPSLGPGGGGGVRHVGGVGRQDGPPTAAGAPAGAGGVPPGMSAPPPDGEGRP